MWWKVRLEKERSEKGASGAAVCRRRTTEREGERSFIGHFPC